MITKSKRKIKCNKCGYDETYTISVKKIKATTKISLCKECLTELYFEVAKIITPKSPRNILNKFEK